ncbi:unnamed protein product [marine sediment metagenome]|uniref:Uncharacterized protein n=1 Tax=marine sediment metagenome TaxID=412755 RepID=X1T3B4_9ZZZZ
MAQGLLQGQGAPVMVVGEVTQDSLDLVLEVKLGENAAPANK